MNSAAFELCVVVVLNVQSFTFAALSVCSPQDTHTPYTLLHLTNEGVPYNCTNEVTQRTTDFILLFCPRSPLTSDDQGGV